MLRRNGAGQEKRCPASNACWKCGHVCEIHFSHNQRDCPGGWAVCSRVLCFVVLVVSGVFAL